MSARHIAPQFEMRFAAEVAEQMQRYTLGTLRELRDVMMETLSKASVNARALAKIAGNEPGSGAAYGKALARWKPGSAVRRKLRTFRTLCLYIAGVEHTQAPRANTAADLPPPERQPELVPGSLSFSDNPNPKNQ